SDERLGGRPECPMSGERRQARLKAARYAGTTHSARRQRLRDESRRSGLGLRLDGHVSLVQSAQGGPVADADNRGVWQARRDHLIDLTLGLLIQGRGRFVDEQPIRFLQERAREEKAL